MELEQAAEDFEAWLAAGEIDSLATIIAEDAWLSPFGEPIISGRAEWIARMGPALRSGNWTEDIIAESVVAFGPVAVERGRYVLDFQPAPDDRGGLEAFHEEGTYLWHWKRVDDRWELSSAMWHRVTP